MSRRSACAWPLSSTVRSFSIFAASPASSATPLASTFPLATRDPFLADVTAGVIVGSWRCRLGRIAGKPKVVVALERSGMYEELGEENIQGNIDDALNRAPTLAREK